MTTANKYFALSIIGAAILAYFVSTGKFKPEIQTVIITHPTEYHFNVDNEGYDFFTEDMKFVGRLKYGQNPTLDSLIDKDNE